MTTVSTMIRVVLFAVITGMLARLSRPALGSPHSHGMYRFFAWECILALVFIDFVDFRQWFRDPLSLRQLFSWLLLFGSIIPGAEGARLLRTRGRPDPQRIDASLLPFEKTTQLVTTGVFRYIRHPLYSSLLLLAWGVFLKLPSWPGAALASLATAFLVATAKAEEAEDLRYFGPTYQDYRRRTKLFIPFVC